MESLDEWLAALAASPTDLPLDDLEARVSKAIEALDREARVARAMGPAHLVATSLALVIGLVAGGMTASATMHTVRHADALAAVGDLAPSTLLEGVG